MVCAPLKSSIVFRWEATKTGRPLYRIFVVGNKIRGQPDREFLEKYVAGFEWLGFLPYNENIIEADLRGEPTTTTTRTSPLRRWCGRLRNHCEPNIQTRWALWRLSACLSSQVTAYEKYFTVRVLSQIERKLKSCWVTSSAS